MNSSVLNLLDIEKEPPEKTFKSIMFNQQTKLLVSNGHRAIIITYNKYKYTCYSLSS